MTTIAWDGQVLAVDRGAWGNGSMVTAHAKLHRVPHNTRGWPGGAFAACGSSERTAIILRWLLDPDAELRPAADPEGIAGMLVSADAECFDVFASGVIQPAAGINAAGSGAQFALGVMVAGRSAIEAVKLAHQWTDAAAHGITWYEPHEDKIDWRNVQG